MAGSSFIPEDLVAPTSSSLFPSTTKDMEAMWKWKKGQDLFGTFAKSSPAWKRYRNDIENAKSQKYYDKNVIYINTYKPVGKQLKDLKK